MFIDEKEIDFSSDWQKYLGDSYSMDMNLYFHQTDRKVLLSPPGHDNCMTAQLIRL